MFSRTFNESVLSLPGMSDIIELVQYPIGHYLPEYGGFTYCRHGGWYECELQSNFLCAREMSGNSSAVAFAFNECVNDQLGAVSDPGHFPRLDVKGALDTCAMSQHIDPQQLYACARERGPQLLDGTASEGNRRGVAFAPTEYINGKQMADYTNVTLAAVCEAYKGANKPPACSSKAAAAAPQPRAQRPCRV